MLDLKFMHPNLPHLIGASSSNERGALFSVYDLDIKHRFVDVIPSWSAIDSDIILNSLLDKMSRDLISGLNHLWEQRCLFASDGSIDCLFLCDARGRFVISLPPETASSDSPANDMEELYFMEGDTHHNAEVLRTISRRMKTTPLFCVGFMWG
ncbi:uncharacterized protein EV420DRAFT_1542635 [Desarmillaria tabescens]|uniref:Uncharacterized protein n=1 Tax=Armillaria tabescens TaxID=1929756 RepID=A0AA39KEM8_ARMTA|nr:uncharacterized protein EV420DRAFT_1542635 [Desarmillaria tabescens]KAK0458501.1 hypothetical protein EV420DRAFT_1542635 [Desarmillaria tabescens]